MTVWYRDRGTQTGVRTLASPPGEPSCLYEKLPTATPHIRLLTLDGFDESDGPMCSLRRCALGERDYIALSYTWGSGPGWYEVVVNGVSVTVRWNLYNFLRIVGRDK